MPSTNTDRVSKIIHDGSGPEVSLPQKLSSEAAELLSGRDGDGKQLDSKTMSSIFQNMEKEMLSVTNTAAALKPGAFNGVDTLVPAKIVTNGADTTLVFGGDDTHAAPLEIKIHTTANGNGWNANAEPVNFSPATEIESRRGKQSYEQILVPNLPQEIDKLDVPDAKTKLRALLSAELTPCTDETTGQLVDSGFGYSLATTLDNTQRAFGFNAAQMSHFIQDTICPSKFPNGTPAQSPDFVASNKLGSAGYKIKNSGDQIQITNSDGTTTFQWQPKS